MRDAAAVAKTVRNAGGIFVGDDAPESLGDYTAGPSHVMPTSGAARYASPLGVHDFLKVTSVVAVDAARLREAGPAAAAIARAEGFTAHARSIELRLDGGDRPPGNRTATRVNGDRFAAAPAAQLRSADTRISGPGRRARTPSKAVKRGVYAGAQLRPQHRTHTRCYALRALRG